MSAKFVSRSWVNELLGKFWVVQRNFFPKEHAVLGPLSVRVRNVIKDTSELITHLL